jgi:hypothetical protein
VTRQVKERSDSRYQRHSVGEPYPEIRIPQFQPVSSIAVIMMYLVAIHHPDDYDPAVAEDAAMHRAIDVLNDEMTAAGVRIFVGGLHPASSAKPLRLQPDGKVLVTDGPYLETKEHVGGFWVLEAADLDEALAWGRKAVIACRAPVEVRPFH